MLKSFFKTLRYTAGDQKPNWTLAFGVVAWTVTAFILGYALLYVIERALVFLHVPLQSINQTVLMAVLAAASYSIILAVIVGVPWLLKGRRTGRTDLGLTRLPTMFDIVLAPAGAVVYLALSLAILLIASKVLPWVDLHQAQDVGFHALYDRIQLLLAFITLVVVAPVAEETIFRGYLYGKLRKYAPIWVAAIVTSVLFGVVHMQWNIALDVFALSLVACMLREVTGSIWVGILIHMMKNGLAFYLLFIQMAK